MRRTEQRRREFRRADTRGLAKQDPRTLPLTIGLVAPADEVIAPGKDEFEKQVLLNDWVHRRFKNFGHPSTKARGALEVLQGIEKGQSFFCAQYAETLVSCAASMSIMP